jgi:hypothetical protein
MIFVLSLHFENNLLTINGVRFSSISEKTLLLKLSFAFISISLPLLCSGYSLPMQASRKRGLGCGHTMRLQGFEGAGANYLHFPYLHFIIYQQKSCIFLLKWDPCSFLFDFFDLVCTSYGVTGKHWILLVGEIPILGRCTRCVRKQMHRAT